MVIESLIETNRFLKQPCLPKLVQDGIKNPISIIIKEFELVTYNLYTKEVTIPEWLYMSFIKHSKKSQIPIVCKISQLLEKIISISISLLRLE